MVKYIYLVWEDNYGPHLHGVFSSIEKAEEYIDSKGDKGDRMFWTGHIVDKED